MSQIQISDLRNIQSLTFEVPTSGVHILTGPNGCGKTSLLIALNRIHNNTAFSAFRPGRKVGMDKFDKSRIKYLSGATTISYKRTNRGWEPTPKKAKPNTLFPFTGCCFISTTEFRFFQPDPSDFYKSRGHVVYADVAEEIKNALNTIFSTNRFDNLKYVTIKEKHGRQKVLHRENILYVIKEPGNEVYTEVNFSLGERLILNTLDYIQGVIDGELLLIDEIELALHPRAQISFYHYIEGIAASKHLTCLISTHSASLVKEAKSRLYMDNHNGVINVLSDCEPAYILRDVTISSDNRPDYLFFVEDEMARKYLSAIMKKCQQSVATHKIIRVIPAGPFDQVVRLSEYFYSVPPFARRNIEAFPDADVKTTINNIRRKAGRSAAEQKLLDLFERNNDNITYLDITPEEGVWAELLRNCNFFDAAIESEYGAQLFSLRDDVIAVVHAEEVGRSPGNPREHAKGCFKNMTGKLRLRIPQANEPKLYDLLFSAYVELRLSDAAELGKWKGVIGGITTRR